MPQLYLKWHYRSLDEKLIAFSNRNFYDNELISFPSVSEEKDDIGICYCHVDGVYDRVKRQNQKEAEKVVELIIDHYTTKKDKSLGVVLFSLSQQELVEEMLEEKLIDNNDVAEIIKESNEPLFIKNLETVQGDERDVIILSLAYARDSSGRFLYNFGPLNKTGGERRLNVAITRARSKMILVSSIHYYDLDLKHSVSSGAGLLRDYLEYCEKKISSINRSDIDDKDLIVEEIALFLEENGYEVNRNMGCSKARISLAVKESDDTSFKYAIEIDDKDYGRCSDTSDRDRLRREVLENKGWKYHRVWSTEWIRNKVIEKQRLLRLVKNAEEKNSSEFHEHFELQNDIGYPDFDEYLNFDLENQLDKFRPYNYKGLIRAIIRIESPISEEKLIRMTLPFFNRKLINERVYQEFEQRLKNCDTYDIIRQNGFVFYGKQKQIKFRKMKEGKREIKDIAIEELSQGIRAVMEKMMAAEKQGVYTYLGKMCGIKKISEKDIERFDRALELIDDEVEDDEGILRLKNNDDAF